ncbi:MAG: phage holin family protein [Oscillospiraceae bacterium]|nr:phage holin family protein [Oscillospiraceae bacterium]
MKAIDRIKVFFVTIFTLVHGWLGVLAVPFIFLVATNIVDYVTGIAAAAKRGERISSSVGFWGIVKKIFMWLLVFVGYVVDYAIEAISTTMHIDINVGGIVALAVIFWLMVNELISILENIHDVGVPLPPFLVKLVDYIKEKTEETADAALPVNTEHREE